MGLLLPMGLGAQTRGPVALAGRLVRVRGADSTALPGAMVVAHLITPERQGPVDSVRADAAGRFRFRVSAGGDTAAVFVVSTRYQGIGYFSEPVAARSPAGAGAMLLAVFDTSAGGPPLQVSVRHLVLTTPNPDGSRPVLDIIQITNPGTTTRVGADSTTPTWSARLPDGIVQFGVGESDVSPSAIGYANGRVSVTAPFPPGVKQVVVNYVAPSGTSRLTVPVEQLTARLEVLVEDSGTTMEGLPQREPVSLEGRVFAHFAGDSVPAGGSVQIRFSRTGGGAQRLGWIAIIAAALALSAGGYAVARRRPATAPEAPPAPASMETLLAQLVSLDERYEGKEQDTPAPEWQQYRDRRHALKSQLAARIGRE